MHVVLPERFHRSSLYGHIPIPQPHSRRPRVATVPARALTMAEQPQQQPEMAAQQWEGAAEARLPSTAAAAAWPHVASFCALHRYLPGIDVCERVAGDDGVPGCVRYVASRPAPPPAEEGDGQQAAAGVETWAREELLEMDGARRRLVYSVVGSNLGFGRYVATMTVVDDDEGVNTPAPETVPAAAAGCKLVWSFECEPVQGWTRDGLLGYLETSVKGMAERIEEAAATAAAAIAVQDAPAACS
ncbi:lachrymatory-factor synthase-like [Oryza brachyantha]|uniref:lachrymatory-factor synthase-like n=1 Tax=Oryza brachyantha TaxID=4533 RepID=UPI001AD9B8E0|nr:lachrymatory-factor synthase-like [Oryza brachyantha]